MDIASISWTATAGRTFSEAFKAPRPIEGCHGLPEIGDCPGKFTLGPVGVTETEVCLRMQDDIATCHSESEGTLASSNGLVMHPRAREHGREKAQDLSQTTRVIKGTARASASCRYASLRPAQQTVRVPSPGRAGGRWPAHVSRCSGRCAGSESLLEAPHGLAVSRRAMAFSPACRQYARALSHTSPRTAWCARRSTCSARRSRQASQWPRQSARGAPAAAPGADCRRPLRGSGHA